MKFWKNWPYWLRGGVIGGGITLIFVVLFYSCNILDTSPGSFLCLPFIITSPIFPFAILFDNLDPFFHYRLPFVFVPVGSVAGWFVVCSLIGFLVGRIKSKQ